MPLRRHCCHQVHASGDMKGDLLEQMDIVVDGVNTLCSAHQELANVKTALEKEVAAHVEKSTLLGDKVRTVQSELQKTLPSKVRPAHLQVSL